jgi:hypothetical protein
VGISVRPGNTVFAADDHAIVGRFVRGRLLRSRSIGSMKRGLVCELAMSLESAVARICDALVP